MAITTHDKIYLTIDDWGVDYSRDQADSLRDELNAAINFSIELGDKSIIDRVLESGKWSDNIVSDTFDVVNAIWVAKFGTDAYDGFVDPKFVKKWADRLGYSPLLPLDVTAQALLEWAEGADAPINITKAVRRSLEEYESNNSTTE